MVLRPLVDRFVAGTDLDAALPVIAGLATDRLVSIDYLGEDTTTATRPTGSPTVMSTC